MDVFPKFIIEDGALIIMKVTYHKDIVTDPTKVKGGGWFKYNSETNTFVLYGESTDFGKATIEDIKQCITDNKVFRNPYSDESMLKRHNFAYLHTDGSIEELHVKDKRPPCIQCGKCCFGCSCGISHSKSFKADINGKEAFICGWMRAIEDKFICLKFDKQSKGGCSMSKVSKFDEEDLKKLYQLVEDFNKE